MAENPFGLQTNAAAPVANRASAAPSTRPAQAAAPAVVGTCELPCVEPLSDRQRLAVRVIQDFVDAYGEAPSVPFVARRMGIDESTVREYLRAACRKGWLATPTPSRPLCRVGA